MNRIILIGNGFDLAHGLETSYNHFGDWYWQEFIEKSMNNIEPNKDEHRYNDKFVRILLRGKKDDFKDFEKCVSYADIKPLTGSSKGDKIVLGWDNYFWMRLCNTIARLETWVDIEMEYYKNLKNILTINDDIHVSHGVEAPNRNKEVKRLNKEFGEVKNLLKEYLSDECKKKLPIINQNEELGEILSPKNGMGDDPERTLALNFNYTPTFKRLYAPYAEVEIINIHGELGNDNNPIIFGYGDDLDDSYKEIEKTQDNDFMQNMKHILYLKTNNYRKLLGFLELAPYQVFTMGHSCGNSDRTLLQTIFEHENCVFIKPFFHAWEKKDEDGNIVKDNGKPVLENDYLEIVKNISRNFNNKKAFRALVVSEELCAPLPQSKKC